MRILSSSYESPIGSLTLVERDGFLSAVLFLGIRGDLAAGAAPGDSPLLRRARRQLGEYFAAERRDFDLPLAPAGTPFQRAAWDALRRIPFGETRTYAEQASALGRPAAFRAVGGANNRNPLAIIVPCHRVIGADGSLTGYAGGLDVKRFLLALEARGVRRPRSRWRSPVAPWREAPRGRA